MKRSSQNLCGMLLAALLAVTLASHVRAAELQLRSECRTKGQVVLLGDVADIFARDPQQTDSLAHMELCLAPPPGSKKILRIREVQDLLALRGFNLADQRFSGASQVTITTGEASPKEKQQRVTGPMARVAQAQVQDAVLKFLQENADADEPWEVEMPQLEDDQIRVLSNGGSQLRVSGGAAPWTGLQTFTVITTIPSGPVSVSVKLKVSLPPAVVVVARTLGKGTSIRADDVKLQRLLGRTVPADSFSRIEDVLGQETTKSVAEGQLLDSQYLRHPLLVKKGEVVTVYARSAGVQIRTTARCRGDGSAGEVVNVESLTDRSQFLARVSGPQEVEVYARGTTLASEPEPPAAAPRKVPPAPRVQPVSQVKRAATNSPSE